MDDKKANLKNIDIEGDPFGARDNQPTKMGILPEEQKIEDDPTTYTQSPSKPKKKKKKKRPAVDPASEYGVGDPTIVV